MEKIYPKKSVKTFYFWNYEGKSYGGEALFKILKDAGLSSSKASECSLIAYENAKAKPRIIIPPTPYLKITMVSPDLKKVLIENLSTYDIKDIDPNKEVKNYKSVRLATEKMGFNAIFSANDDTLFIPTLGTFSTATGEKLRDFHFATSRLKDYSSSFSSDMKWTTGKIRLTGYGGDLICLLNSANSNYLVPLIDPFETETTIKNTSNAYAEDSKWHREKEAKLIADYNRRMEAEHGVNWREEYGNNPLQKKSIPTSSSSDGKSNHTCQGCFGSGRIVDPVQDNLYQDKNSGRWYKKLGTIYRNCMVCDGKGYVTY